MLIDSTSQEPVAYATVVLVDTKTQKQKNGTMTEDDGGFKLPEVNLGEYELHISFLGYQTKIVKGVELTPEKPDFDVETVYLLSEGVTLDAVEVTGESAVIENRIDKMVYNADKDVTTVGGDAVDVLQKVPLLAVDLEGNVSLRGSSNIQILINGKPSTMFSGNISEALRSIPADQIKSVEVITTPTAKYDGEGSAGIVNIITKKKNAEGITGSINTSVGTRSNRGSVNLGFARGRFGLNLNGSGWYGWPREATSDFLRRDILTDPNTSEDYERVLQQDGVGEGNFFGPRAAISAFYDINAYNSITSSFNFSGRGRNSEQVTKAFLTDPRPSVDIMQEYDRISESNSFRNGFDWTTDYRKTFKKPDQELALAFQVSGDNSTSDNLFTQQDLTGLYPELNRQSTNTNDGLNLEYTLQTDYTHPFGDNVKMETGAKAILRDIDSDFRYENIADGIAVPTVSDIFYYDQDVLAGYMSFNVKMGEKYGLVAGARYEHTRIGGEFEEFPTTFENEYDNFLPSFILSRKLNQFSSLKVSYTRRIQRPSLRFINPYIEQEDPREITVGNPLLDPELTDQFELTYNTYVKGIVINGAVYYRYTDDIIESFTSVVDTNGIDGVSLNTFRNIGVNRSIGFNLFSSGTIRKFLTLRGGFNIYTYNGESRVADIDLSRQALVWRVNMNASIKLPSNFVIEMFGFYNSPRQTLQGSRAAFSMFSIGAKKEIWDKRGSIGVSAFQPFTRTLSFPQKLEGENFYQESNRNILIRSFNLTFSYRFGKIDFRNRRSRRSTISNDDLKSGGDDGQNY